MDSKASRFPCRLEQQSSSFKSNAQRFEHHATNTSQAGGMIVRRFSPTDLRVVGKILVEKRPKSKVVFVGAILENLMTSPGNLRTNILVYSCPMLKQCLRESTNWPSVNSVAAKCSVFHPQWSKPTIGLIIATSEPDLFAIHADFAVATGNQFMAETLSLGIPVLMTPRQSNSNKKSTPKCTKPTGTIRYVPHRCKDSTRCER